MPKLSSFLEDLHEILSHLALVCPLLIYEANLQMAYHPKVAQIRNASHIQRNGLLAKEFSRGPRDL